MTEYALTNEPELAATWAPAKGVFGWLSETGHKEIGMRYIFTAMCFFAVAGIEAAFMRMQLSRPNNALLSPDTFKQRAPGMSLDRIPLFVWSMIVTSFMIIFAMPSVMLDSGFLALDRLVATQFFNQPEGGDTILYQHFFWFFGHPEVYIIFIPA